MSTNDSRPADTVTFHLPKHSLKIAGAAFGAGLLLFFVVWLSARKDNDFYRADTARSQADNTPLAPLPEPLPASGGASRMPEAKPVPVEEQPKLVEQPPAPPSPAPLPADTPPPGDAPTPDAGVANAQDVPTPIPGQSPPPEYPAEALRNGETGTVIVQVQVDRSGVPTDARVVQRSGSRSLDRAALAAVRRWRFQPAMVDGQAVPGTLDVPFDFKAQ